MHGRLDAILILSLLIASILYAPAYYTSFRGNKTKSKVSIVKSKVSKELLDSNDNEVISIITYEPEHKQEVIDAIRKSDIEIIREYQIIPGILVKGRVFLC